MPVIRNFVVGLVVTGLCLVALGCGKLNPKSESMGAASPEDVKAKMAAGPKVTGPSAPDRSKAAPKGEAKKAADEKKAGDE